MIFKARFRTGSDTEYQLLSTHLEEAGMYAELFAKKIGLSKPALLTALVHDLGKFSSIWQKYLEKSHKEGRKGKPEDHSTAGGQYLYEAIKEKFGDAGELIGQFLAACVIYHHGSGLPDVIGLDGTPRLYNRLLKDREKTHIDEAAANLDPTIKQKIDALLSDPNFISETAETLNRLMDAPVKDAMDTPVKNARYFNLGLSVRALSSCLIDGDRRSSALDDREISVRLEEAAAQADWTALLKRLEDHLAGLPAEGKINEIRRKVSERCAAFAEQGDGVYTLTAATGAGKTLASLRYALTLAERASKDHIAERAGKDHIFIIAPYTSILDQNADIIRGILDPAGENGEIVLEHHSNLEKGEQTEHFADSSETWNTPVIITTMVQFLETLFGSGTRKIRRMHQLAN
ncbi:MAG: CRISPR-associated endonuclease Cas3'', partial [Spirochaetaceae bacterium]|nr:CRISPR-associated endonuclease Cas3'' [Spirochaetaceae bacterium]